jgi:TRAP-type C4-dicarboxylate transport system substrate-binding protein
LGDLRAGKSFSWKGGRTVKHETKIKKWVIGLVLAALLMGLGPGGVSFAAEKKIIKLKIGSGHPLATDWIRFTSDFFCKELVKRVNERTNYRLDLAEHWAGSVAKLGEELEAVEMGLLEMGAVIVPFEPTKMYLHNWAYSIPFFCGDPRMAGRVALKLYNNFPALTDELKKYHQLFLGTGGAGDYGLITMFPVRTAADVKGRKIAAAGPNLPWISGVGAVPVQSNLNEAYTSLQTGVYEGWVMFASSNVKFKLHEICKYFADMNFGCATATTVLTINQDVWKKTPKEVQAIMKEVGQEFTLKEMNYIYEQQVKDMKVMKDSGVQIYSVPFEEKVKWANALVNQPKKFAKEADARGWPGTALMKAAIKYAEEEGHAFPRKWMEE